MKEHQKPRVVGSVRQRSMIRLTSFWNKALRGSMPQGSVDSEDERTGVVGRSAGPIVRLSPGVGGLVHKLCRVSCVCFFLLPHVPVDWSPGLEVAFRFSVLKFVRRGGSQILGCLPRCMGQAGSICLREKQQKTTHLRSARSEK